MTRLPIQPPVGETPVTGGTLSTYAVTMLVGQNVNTRVYSSRNVGFAVGLDS